VCLSDLRATSPDGVAGTRSQTDGIADSQVKRDTGGGLGGARCKHAWPGELLYRENAAVGQPIQWRWRGPLTPPGPVKHRNPKIANAVASRSVNIRASPHPHFSRTRCARPDFATYISCYRSLVKYPFQMAKPIRQSAPIFFAISFAPGKFEP